MTGTTTQVMIDLADRICGSKGSNTQSNQRLVQMSINVLLFAIGCGSAALAYSFFGVGCFLVLPIVGSLLLITSLMQRPQSRS